MNPLGNNNDGLVTGTFTFNAQLPNGKTLSMSGYLAQGEDRESINLKMDTCAQAIDRQRLIAEVPELEAKLQQMEDALEQMTVIMMSVESSQKKGAKLTSAQKTQMDAFAVNIPKVKKDIERGQAAVAHAREMAAKA